jgi:NAD(P)-dependent dehydrogenase (short-subunit alcohol dehydrogenase family)
MVPALERESVRDASPETEGEEMVSPNALAGRTALVTGAGKRLGQAVARGLAGVGANIVIHYGTSRDDAERLVDELVREGRRAWAIRADLADSSQVESLIPTALEAAGGVDILVNNASIFFPSTMGDARVEGLMRNIEVNAWAPFALSRAFAGSVARGTIVNFLDTRVKGYDWRHVEYILSKHTLEVLTRMSALEFAPGVTVNAVAPGLILPPPGEDESYLEAMKDTVPLKRYGSAADIVDAVLFLVTSSYLTGQVIYVDGGRHLEAPS